VLLFEREGRNEAFESFIITNCEQLFKLFDQLETDANYFSKREGLKTQYMLLAKNDVLRKIYTRDRERLKAIMVTVLNQNKGIQYEAFLLLSLFILMPLDDNAAVRFILHTNKANLNDFIKGFQNEKDEQDFIALKNRMREVLDEL
jgi:Mo25-like